MALEWLQPLHGPSGGGWGGGRVGELPAWLWYTYLGVSVALVAMAGLMSGLTLGLMSLDELDLEVLKRSGTEQEKRHARRIMPVIANEHFLLVTLLLFNALSTEALPIFLDKLVDPVTAVLLSVSVVLVIGEIVPQAVCSRYGLQVGSHSALLVRLLMVLSSPISWPVGRLLDVLLGDEHTALFRRAQLKALVNLHSSAEGLGGTLTGDEISIITGALDLTNKTAASAMTPLNKVFMLPADRVLDEATLQEILISGHSRVPLHEPGDRRRLLGLILVKELVLVDPGAALTAGQLVSRSLPQLPADTPLYQLLRLFEAGGSHMVALTQPQPPPRPSAEAQRSGSLPAPARGSAPASAAATPRTLSGGGGGGGGAATLPRIKSGIIKAGDNKMLYIEAEQRPPLSPQGSWSVGGPCSPPLSPAAAAGAAAGGGSGTSGGAAPSGEAGWERGGLGGAREGEPVGIITIEDVIEELLQQEIIDETDQYVDNLQVTRVDAYALTTSLPPRLRKAYAQQFTPRVGRLVVHHPSAHMEHHYHGSAEGAGSGWHGLTGFKQQQLARGAYSNPTTPLYGTPLGGSPDSAHLSPLALAVASGGSGSSSVGAGSGTGGLRHSRMSSEQLHASCAHMPQVPEQRQMQVAGGSQAPSLPPPALSSGALLGHQAPGAGAALARHHSADSVQISSSAGRLAEPAAASWAVPLLRRRSAERLWQAHGAAEAGGPARALAGPAHAAAAAVPPPPQHAAPLAAAPAPAGAGHHRGGGGGGGFGSFLAGGDELEQPLLDDDSSGVLSDDE